MNFSQFGNDLYTGARSFPIVAKRRLWFTIALTLMALSFAVLGVRGLNPGIVLFLFLNFLMITCFPSLVDFRKVCL